MKKVVNTLWFFILIMCLATASAEEIALGSTITVTLTVTDNSYAAVAGGVGINYDDSILEFVSATSISAMGGEGTPTKENQTFIFSAMTAHPVGDLGTIEFKVKSDAVAGKTIQLTPRLVNISDINGDPVDIEIKVTPSSIKTKCVSHTWNSGETTTPATCKANGIRTYTCTNGTCGATKTETIPKADHTSGTAVRENEVSATCKEAGSYDEVVYCSVCGTEISRIAKVIDKLTTHTPDTAVRENEVPATCKEAGSYDEVVYCSTCGTEISRTAKNIDKLATHTDENKDFICDICGENLCTQHTPGNAVRENEVAATCKDAGSYEEVVYCSNCGTEISRTVKSIDKLTTHTPGTAVREKEVPATCKEAGSYDEVVYCSTCGTEISRTAKVIDKLTTHTDANSDYTCDVCGTNLCLQHTPDAAVRENEVPATCKDAGSYDEVVYCITCHTEISRAAKVIDKLTTHTPDAAVHENEVAATCKTAGSYDEVVYCSVCDAELSRIAKVIDKLTAHTPGDAVCENEVPANCKEEGSYDEVIYCSVCGTEISRVTKTIDKLTTHTDDDADEICDVCGADLSLPVVSKVTVIGGSGSGDYTEGDTVSISADTADTTKVFKGWSGIEGLTLTLGNATTPYLSFLMPDHDVAITAKFEMVETYTVSFNSNGGTGSMEAVANILGEYTLPECKFVAPAGKQFKGWALAADGEIITDTYSVTRNVTLYAIWEEAAILPEVTIPTTATLVDVNEGETGTMSITATNATAYQWYINRNDGLGYVKIDGATTSTYTTSAVNLTNDGYTYYCVASNVTGSAQSSAFTLNVIAKVVIPETGDNANLAMWFALMLVSCVGLFLLKRNGYQQIS